MKDGDELLRLLRETGRSQTAFAEEIDVSKGTVSHWCCGKSRVPKIVLIYLRSELEKRKHILPDSADLHTGRPGRGRGSLWMGSRSL